MFIFFSISATIFIFPFFIQLNFLSITYPKMAEKFSLSTDFKSLSKAILHLLLLAITLRCANAARITPTPSNSPGTATGAHPPPLSFFMHDILGGTAPSGRVVAGIISNTQINGLPFSKHNSRVFPMKGGIPFVSANNGILNNNLPFLGGLNGATASIVNGNTLPFVTAGQLPQGTTLQKLMFGTITVIDDEITEGHEIGASVIGKAQGFHLASSLDGSSQTMAFSAMFGDHEEDTISFFGVHRMVASESQIAIVGGTGKYDNAEGYATIKTIHLTNQHTTDGVETLIQFNVYVTQ